MRQGCRATEGGIQRGGRRRWLDSPRLFLWQIPTDVLGEDNKRCASRSTLKRPAKLITLFHLSHSEDSLPWIQPQRKEQTSNLPSYAEIWHSVNDCLPECWLQPCICCKENGKNRQNKPTKQVHRAAGIRVPLTVSLQNKNYARGCLRLAITIFNEIFHLLP